MKSFRANRITIAIFAASNTHTIQHTGNDAITALVAFVETVQVPLHPNAGELRRINNKFRAEVGESRHFCQRSINRSIYYLPNDQFPNQLFACCDCFPGLFSV